MDVKIIGMGTAVPENKYSQAELFETYLQPYFSNQPRAAAIFSNTGIGSRHLMTRPDFYQQERTTEERNSLYMQSAQELGEAAIRKCLENSGVKIDDIDDFLVISCTGIDTPGLDLLLAGKLGMKSSLRRSTILGMGCYAALPGLARAYQSALARPGKNVLILAIEICSLHFQNEDSSLENAVCSALFADGAAAAVVRAAFEDGQRLPKPSLIDFSTFCDYKTLDQMAFHLTDHGFRMRLGAYVPRILSAQIGLFVDRMLLNNGLTRQQVSYWGVHPGSSKILDYTQEQLGIGQDGLDCSREILYRYGNMSSPTILFILQTIQQDQRPKVGEYGVLLAFGPGLTIEGTLLRWS